MKEGVIRQSGSGEAKKKTMLKQKAESKPLTETFAHGKLPFVIIDLNYRMFFN